MIICKHKCDIYKENNKLAYNRHSKGKNVGMSPYDRGFIRCKTCAVYIPSGTVTNCPCCGRRKLRLKAGWYQKGKNK